MPARHAEGRALAVVAAVSGLYDIALGAAMLFGRQAIVALFDVPAVVPPIHADLNGLFLTAVGIGYVLPFRRPARYRGYLWVMGPFLKGIGCLVFVADHFVRHSPAVYLVFALTDGALALFTLWALLRPAPDR